MEKKKRNILREIAEWIFLIFMAFLITSIIQSELFALTEVNMESMVGTLEPGDKLIMSKLAYTFSEPERGDIIIFLRNEPIGGVIGRASIFINDILLKLHKQFRRNRLIKRVIAVPGDTVEIRDNILYVNGEPQNEPYARVDPLENTVLNGELEKTLVLPGELFVMGDNRGQSLDSRSFGKIDMSWVEGKAVFRVMPLAKFGSIYK